MYHISPGSYYRQWFLQGVVAWALCGVILKLALQSRSTAIEEYKTINMKASPSNRIDAELEYREQVEQELFENNLRSTFFIRRLSWRSLGFLEDGEYRFASRVNVLLGKNGYGKTLLFRSIVAALQRDRDRVKTLFGASSRATVELTCDGETTEIQVDKGFFTDEVGKISLLAIPDSRFVNRTIQTVSGAATSSEPLCRSGAKHFLSQEPYENVVQELLTQLVLDFLSNPTKGLNQPLFRLIEGVVRELTDDSVFAFADMERAGRGAYRVLVRSEGSPGNAIPIQYASQGTLSVVAIFGLIYSFLHSVRPNAREEDIPKIPAIVFIDEIDAHLHPSWQQKILGLLTSRFPNVQFVVSGHSPLIVAGCDWGEVSVMRKGEKGFRIETLDEDFLGATAKDLYNRVFEIEDIDRLYLQYAVDASLPENAEKAQERERLSKKTKRTADEEQRLNELLRESRLVRRAAEAREQRLKSENSRAYVLKLERQVEKLQAELNKKNQPTEDILLRKAKGGGDVVA